MTLCLLTTSFFIIGNAFAEERGGAASEQAEAIQQEIITTEAERKASSDAAKIKIEELKKQQKVLLAKALQELQEQVKAKKIERSEYDKQNQKEIDDLMKQEVEAKKLASGTLTSAGASATPLSSTKKP